MGLLDEQAGERRSDDTGEITYGVLDSHPAARGTWTGEDLRHGERTRRRHSAKDLIDEDSPDCPGGDASAMHSMQATDPTCAATITAL